MEESAERRSAAVVTRVVCLQGLWRVDYRIVSAISRGGLSGYWRWPLSWRGGCCARQVCRKALLSAMGALKRRKWISPARNYGRIDTILVKEGQFVREGEVLAKMDTRVLFTDSDWKPSRKSKKHKAPLPPRRLCRSNAKAKLVPHSRWSINARPNWTP
ncbi:hypothetical protein ACLB1M_27335 [Escherichia coli]